MEQLVPGDIVRLSAGDMIPADLRLLAAKDLFVNQSALTGEAMPSEKSRQPSDRSVVAIRSTAQPLLHGRERRQRIRNRRDRAYRAEHLFRPARGPDRRATTS